MGKFSRTFPFTAKTKVQEITPDQESRKCVMVFNNGSVTAYILASQNDKYTDGIPVKAGATYINDTTTAALYAVTASSTTDLRVQVDSD